MLIRLIIAAFFGKRYDEDPNLYYKTVKDYPDMKCEEVKFMSGENKLAGAFYRTTENFNDIVIFCHGLGAGHHSYTTEIHALAEAGHLVFSFDYTGCAYSEGKSIISFYQAVKDLQAAVRYIRGFDEYKKFPLKMAGHSWGGYVASMSLTLPEACEIDRVAVFAPLNDPVSTFAGQIQSIAKIPVYITKPIIRFWFKRIGGKELLKSSAEAIGGSDIPVLVIQGDKDMSIPYGMSVTADERAKKNPNFKASVKPDRGHNVYQSVRSEKYLNETFAKINKLKLSIKPKDRKELKSLYKSIDYNLITEEAPDVMAEFLGFLK